MWSVVLLILAGGGLCLLGFLQEWVTNANRQLYVESLYNNIEAAEREVTRTANVVYDWPSDETRADFRRAVAYRDQLLRGR